MHDMQDAVLSCIAGIISAADTASARKKSDYIGTDGLLHCGICKMQKQCKVTVFGTERIVGCACACSIKEYQAERERADKLERDEMREICFTEKKYRKAFFSTDDGKTPELTHLCKKYAEKFSINAKWLLLYGDTGTGKSYGAAMIANFLIDAGYSCRFCTLPEAERKVWGAKDKEAMYYDFAVCDLLIIDDYGMERRTEYMAEVKFSIIDMRLKSGKPCIITTNLRLADMMNPTDFAEKRLASRIFERSIPYEAKGDDRRLVSMIGSAKSALADLLE